MIELSLLDLPLRRDQLLELIRPELRRQAPPGSPQPEAADADHADQRGSAS